MGGDVVCDATPGRGSRFRFTRPCVASRPAEAAVATATEAHCFEGRVLVVENNPVNALIAKTMLEQLGLDVGQQAGQRAETVLQREPAAGLRVESAWRGGAR